MVSLPEDRIRIPHGITNTVYEIAGQATICKVAGPTTQGVYCSLSREAAACRFLCDHLPGITPHVLLADLPKMLLLSFVAGLPLATIRSRLTSQQRKDLILRLGDMLGRIHCVTDVPLELHWPFRGDNWPERAMASMAAVSATVEQAQLEMRNLMYLCRRHQEARLYCLEGTDEGLVHGDFGGANILICPDDLSIAGVVDWEWASLADPDLDLARLHWLGAVGRSAHIWANLDEQVAFYRGYKQHRCPTGDVVGKFRWYGLWFATSYLAFRLHRGMLIECRPLVQYIQNELNKDR